MSREPFDFKKFAAERSTQNSKVSGELGKSAAQATMLINGGAATAILTFVKGTAMGGLGVGLGLVGYGVGVLSGAWMMYCMNRLLDWRSEFWQSCFNPEKYGTEYRASALRNAETWLGRKNRAFGCSAICFALASVWVAVAIYR